MIFARLVNENFDFQEELLAIHVLTGGTKSSDKYEALNSVSEFGDFKKCSCIVTDCAKSKAGSQTGLARLLREKKINYIAVLCIIHQEVLCGKVLKM